MNHTPTPLVEVIQSTFRWRVAIDGITELSDDWFFSRGRAIEHAVLNARVLGAPRICLKTGSRSTEAWLHVAGAAGGSAPALAIANDVADGPVATAPRCRPQAPEKANNVRAPRASNRSKTDDGGP